MKQTLDDGEYAYAVKMVKQGLMGHIATTVALQNLSQRAAAEVLEIDQPNFSRIASGRHERFSIDYLVMLCRKMGYGVELSFYPIDPRGH